jgi:glycyl-tRNA synthetase beta subunit
VPTPPHTHTHPLTLLPSQTLIANNISLSLSAAVELAAQLQPIAVSDVSKRDVLSFVTRRLEQLLVDGGASQEAGAGSCTRCGVLPCRLSARLCAARTAAPALCMPLPPPCSIRHVNCLPPLICSCLPCLFTFYCAVSASQYPLCTVRAVLAERGDDPALAAATVTQLQAALDEGEAGALRRVLTALSRPTRIVRGAANKAGGAGSGKDAGAELPSVRPELFEQDEERALAEAATVAAAALQSGRADVSAWLAAASGLVAPIDAFFEGVFVMCEDEAVRANRLALLARVAGVARGFADLSQLPGF